MELWRALHRRGCGICVALCPKKILLIDEDSKAYVTEREECIGCRQCTKKCPYSLDTPKLLKKNYEDYRKVLSGETKV